MSFALSRRALLAGASAMAALAASPARAATVTLIVPYPPGGAVDQLGRLLAEKLEPKLGTIVVENRGGAGGSIGTGALARAEPDGSTLGLLNVTQLIANRYLYPSLPYDPDADLTPITRVATGTIVCVANAETAREKGWKSFRDLIAWSKANPDQVRMGSSGVGTISHLGIELVKQKTGASIVHVPYKGGGPAILDLLGGQIEIMFDVTPAIAPQVREGKFVALAVGSKERIAALPDVPSMKEFSDLGLGDVDIQTWYALAGPKGLADDKAKAVFDAVTAAMTDAGLRAKLEPTGFSPVTDGSPAELKKRIADENPYWKELVRISGAKLE
ncbi:tripartite tricarboxylate transporter substrate binding protein [Methylopila sp. M107]|uniref:Bug family tripartite tricarboxylate transporter substrate binding protein n=1 Tax=Methylopila sp. M107 TaxID=1101190 RepID=UPI00036DAA0E|nr:tripartite tricarboxylate transporter substrate binding protein [Methylopila sp. M107]